MTVFANISGGTSSSAPAKSDTGEFTTGGLLAALDAHRDKRLVFSYEGRDVQAGYHVTEVKSGAFSALDCGANPESWKETFIQLWDVPEEGRTHMAAGKFLAIMGKVARHVSLDDATRLTFEVSDGAEAMRLYMASDLHVAGDFVRVTLARRPASCKPRDRWLAEQQAAACCGNAMQANARQAPQACCG
jgi:hypothetical protein